MRVKWTEPVDMPEEYWDAPSIDPKYLKNDYAGEVIGPVRALGETRLVVMLDSGKVREVPIGMVTRA